MKTWNLTLAALFLLFALLQLNDPDPLRWAVIYTFVAGVCAFAAFGKFNRYVIWAGIGVCAMWMAFWLPEFIGWIKLGMPNIAGQMKAELPHIEYTREFLGLLICLVVLCWQHKRGKR